MVLLEDMHSRILLLAEGQDAIRAKLEEAATKQDIQTLTQRLDTIEAAVTSTNHQVHDHEGRISHLEAYMG